MLVEPPTYQGCFARIKICAGRLHIYYGRGACVLTQACRLGGNQTPCPRAKVCSTQKINARTHVILPATNVHYRYIQCIVTQQFLRLVHNMT